jgi:inner membrane protease ATP23
MATSETPDSATAAHSAAGADFLPGSDVWTRWRNFYRMASGRMSPEGQKKYWHDADVRYEAVDCKRCETQRDWLLQYSPIVRFMGDNIRQLGGDLGKHNIRCRRCETGMQGGFDQTYGIKLCANYVETRKQMEDTMAHEMVHAYDHLRFKVDWDAQDLRHVACTEVSFLERWEPS